MKIGWYIRQIVREYYKYQLIYAHKTMWSFFYSIIVVSPKKGLTWQYYQPYQEVSGTVHVIKRQENKVHYAKQWARCVEEYLEGLVGERQKQDVQTLLHLFFTYMVIQNNIMLF